MYVCLCKGWSESDVRQAARDGDCTGESLTYRLGLLDEECCGICLTRLDEFEAIARQELQTAGIAAGGLGPEQNA